MRIPDATFTRIKDNLWAIADERNWPTLSDQEKSTLYEEWIRDNQIGGVLSRYIDTGNVRVYIKDTIMKPYMREHIKDSDPILSFLNLTADAPIAERYIKPHGRRLLDGKVICWGLSRDWKAVLFAVFERSFWASNSIPYAAVIMFPTGKCQQPEYRRMVELAARDLGIRKLAWYDTNF